MPDENGMRTTRVPVETLDWWRGEAAIADAEAVSAHPEEAGSRRAMRNAMILDLLLAATDHDDWERIAHHVLAVRQVLDEVDGR